MPKAAYCGEIWTGCGDLNLGPLTLQSGALTTWPLRPVGSAFTLWPVGLCQCSQQAVCSHGQLVAVAPAEDILHVCHELALMCTTAWWHYLLDLVTVSDDASLRTPTTNQLRSNLRNPTKYPIPHSRTKRYQFSLNYSMLSPTIKSKIASFVIF